MCKSVDEWTFLNGTSHVHVVSPKLQRVVETPRMLAIAKLCQTSNADGQLVGKYGETRTDV